MFSQTKITGSCQIEARFIASCTTPMLAAPSPKKATATWSVPRTRAESAAPTACGVPMPTIGLTPSIPTETSVMCIEPPLPRLVPVDLP